MFDEQKELDTIKTEHNFFNVGDLIPVNRFDEHDMHIKEHKKFKKSLEEQEDTDFNRQKLLILNEHITNHELFKSRIKNKSNRNVLQ